MLSVPAAYTSENAYHKAEDGHVTQVGFAPPPAGAGHQEIADHALAAELQKVEQVDAGTVRTMQKIYKEENEEEEVKKEIVDDENDF